MPVNLPPEALEAEQRYREAKTIPEKIARLEEFLSTIPKHKGTDKLRADLRRRLSKLRAAAKTKKGVGKRESPYHIDREGAGQVVVIGPTNVGKSALVATLTSASPEVSEAPFTTWRPTPGMMPWENIQIQLIDTPPLDRGYVEPELLDLIRRADMILLAVDLQTDPVGQLEECIALLEEHRIVPEHHRERFPQEDPRYVFKPLLVLVNKYDDESYDEYYQICCELVDDEWPMLPVSAATGHNLEQMKRMVFDRLEIIRVYSKPPGREPDFSAPFVMKKGGTVEEFAGKVHQDFLKNLKAARVWGSTAFDGQMVSRDYVLHDGDVVELRI
jgi:hypothetical protein